LARARHSTRTRVNALRALQALRRFSIRSWKSASSNARRPRANLPFRCARASLSAFRQAIRPPDAILQNKTLLAAPELALDFSVDRGGGTMEVRAEPDVFFRRFPPLICGPIRLVRCGRSGLIFRSRWNGGKPVGKSARRPVPVFEIPASITASNRAMLSSAGNRPANMTTARATSTGSRFPLLASSLRQAWRSASAARKYPGPRSTRSTVRFGA
jgi:hypothetical protein